MEQAAPAKPIAIVLQKEELKVLPGAAKVPLAESIR